MRERFSTIGEGALDILYPPVCGTCGAEADTVDHLICSRCWDSITGFSEPYCLDCLSFIPEGIHCNSCRAVQISVFSLGYYENKLQNIIHDLKFMGLKPLADPLGRKLAEMISAKDFANRFDAIIPIPLHHNRKISRGYNQAEEIAVSLGEELHIEVLPNALVMSRKTKQQARLNKPDRLKNMHNALSLNCPISILREKAILLVDDVSTTGATLTEAARVLRTAGSGFISAAVAATAL